MHSDHASKQQRHGLAESSHRDDPIQMVRPKAGAGATTSGAGKKPRTSILPATSAPIQQKPGHKNVADAISSSSRSVQRKTRGDADDTDWAVAAFRPDLFSSPTAPVQTKGGDASGIREAATAGVSGSGSSLPFLDTIQESFGHHDVSGIRSHTNIQAQQAAQTMGAQAFATGNDVAFGGTPDLHTVAHEAAHIVQQRAGLSLPGGVGRQGDSHEQHADAVADRVVQGQSATDLLDGYTDCSAVQMSAAVQRKDGVAVDVLSVGSDFAWTYMQGLLEQYPVEQAISSLIERGCLYLIDYATDILNVDKYLAIINPYIGILKKIKDVIEMIPEPIRVVLGFGVGWAVRKFSTTCLKGWVTEEHINNVLIDSGDLFQTLGSTIDFLSSLGTDTAGSIYKGLWNTAKYLGVTAHSSVTGLLFGEDEEQPEESEQEQTDKQSDNKMVDANLGFFWLQVNKPELAKWNDRDDGEERGGLQLDSKFGVKLFGNVMGTEKLQVRVPYSGDWEMMFFDVSLLSNPIGLAGIFQGGPITAQKVRITNEGLQFLYVVVQDMRFGDDVVVIPSLTVAYRAGDNNLAFRGEATVNMLQHVFNGKAGLDVGTDGEFRGGSIALKSPDRFEIIRDKLVLENPALAASFAKGEKPDISAEGDLHLNLFDKLSMTSQRTRLAYGENGIEGGVDLLFVDIPVGDKSHVRFELHDALVSKNGFEASKAVLIYAYGDEQEQQDGQEQNPSEKRPKPGGEISKSQIGEIMPGFNMDWIKHSGLETLVVDATATGITLDRSGLHVEELSKRLAKLKASLFGVGAEFDADAGRGGVFGKFNYKPPLPNVQFDFPIVPGLGGSVGIKTNLELGALLNGTLQKQPPRSGEEGITPWALGGKAGLNADASVLFTIGAHAGIPWLASIHADLFAEAGARFNAEAGLAGTVLVDENTNSLKLDKSDGNRPKASYDFSTELHASIGAQIRARFFYFMEATLWQYRFKEWQLGEYRLSGDIVSTPDGKVEVIPKHTGFVSEDGKPKRPDIEYKQVYAWEVLDNLAKQGDKIEDKRQLWRLVHDVADPGAGLEPARRSDLYEQIKKLNGTNKDPDLIAQEIIGFTSQRRDAETRELSLLMTKPEWVKYSTTSNFFGKTRRSDDVEAIDDCLDRYHNASSKEDKLAILQELIDVHIFNYMGRRSKSRHPMVAKLESDAEREKARLTRSEDEAEVVAD